MWIPDILVRIRILGSVPLSTDPDADPGGPKVYASGRGSGTLVKSNKEVSKQ
jgi:hypothetical protein